MNTNKLLTKEYKIMLKNLLEITNRIDPIGLIAFGAPKDEYYSEVVKIAQKLIISKTIEEFQRNVKDIFGKSFGEDIVDMNKCVSLVNKIWALKTISPAYTKLLSRSSQNSTNSV